jgi:hypothetical protein
MSVTFNVNSLKSTVKTIQKKLNNLPREAHAEFVKSTPIRSGNARRNTKLNGNVINANYPYAQRLDDGYSPQSPDGMTNPTLNFVKKRLEQIMKGK